MEAVAHANSYHLPSAHPRAQPWLGSLKKELIGKVVKSTLAEAAISTAMVGVTCLFVVTPGVQISFIIIAVSVIAFNTLMKSASAYMHYETIRLQNSTKRADILKREDYQLVNKVLSYVCPFTFSMLYALSLDILIHEGGHAFAANQLLQHSNPVITIDLGEGVTKHFITPLTSLGEKIGRSKIDALISASGTGLSLLASLVYITAGYYLNENHPTTSKYLFSMAFMSIFNSICYAISALASNPIIGHDFVALAAAGIHPLVSAAIILLIPLIWLALLYCLSLAKAQLKSVISA